MTIIVYEYLETNLSTKVLKKNQNPQNIFLKEQIKFKESCLHKYYPTQA